MASIGSLGPANDHSVAKHLEDTEIKSGEGNGPVVWCFKNLARTEATGKLLTLEDSHDFVEDGCDPADEKRARRSVQ